MLQYIIRNKIQLYFKLNILSCYRVILIIYLQHMQKKISGQNILPHFTKNSPTARKKPLTWQPQMNEQATAGCTSFYKLKYKMYYDTSGKAFSELKVKLSPKTEFRSTLMRHMHFKNRNVFLGVIFTNTFIKNGAKNASSTFTFWEIGCSGSSVIVHLVTGAR